MYKDWDIIVMYVTMQPLSRDAWEYVAAQKHDGSGLLVVSRQTIATYLPVTQDRLAIGDLQLMSDD